jgi:hypothetical protein
MAKGYGRSWEKWSAICAIAGAVVSFILYIVFFTEGGGGGGFY